MQIRKRITLIVLVMLVLAVAGAYANGQADNAFDKKESVTLTGKIVIKNRMLPELNANGKTYFLLVPHFLPSGLSLKDGDQVTISGNIVALKDTFKNRAFDGVSDSDTLVSVDKATINGKEYNMNDFARKYNRGPRGGMGRGMMGWGTDDSSD